MRTIVDFHIHSKYSRATSKHLDLAEIAHWASLKGLDVVSCGDMTHPKWIAEIEATLREDGSGLLQHPEYPAMRFILGSEIACIYSHKGATRRLHHVIMSPSIASAKKFNDALIRRGAKLASDGRPIVGLSSKDLLAIMLETDPHMVMIPAHVWTPWFALFGSKSGYDDPADCFEDLAEYIFALETGLSSDPAMNWQWSKLDRFALVSNSDAHSGKNLGREANVFDLPSVTYDSIIEAVKTKNPKTFLYTIEFFPEEGMYHVDGHRACGIALQPAETKRHKGICPRCKKPLTIGVLHRVDNLRDRNRGEQPASVIPYKTIVPLPEIIGEYYDIAATSKKVMQLYHDSIARLKSEFALLLDVPEDELRSILPEGLTEGIIRMRNGDVKAIPGYDGKYGSVSVFSGVKRTNAQQQLL